MVIEAVVTDRDGNPVRDLGPSDFTITAGDEHPAVSAFAAVDSVSGAARSAPPLPLPVKIDPGGEHRAFGLVVDDAGVPADTSDVLRAAILQFVNDQIGPRDTVALFRTSGGGSGVEHMTSDKGLLRSAVGQIRFNPAAVQPSVPPWPQTLAYALSGLHDVPGRKAAVVFCRRAPAACAFDALVSQANRSWSGIYTVYAGGDAAAPACLAGLAKGTGGLNLSGDISAALRRLAVDHASYYLLGVSPDDRPLAREEAISVTVARPGLEVRSRRQPPAVRVPSFLADAGPPQVELRRLVASPLKAGSMRARLSAAFRRNTITNVLELSMVVDGHDISFTHRLNGRYEAGIDLLLNIFDSAGALVESQSNTATVSTTREDFQGTVDEGLPVHLGTPVAKPGVYQVYAAVRDATSSNTGLCHTLVEIPDVSKGGLCVSGIRLFRAAVPEPPEGKVDADSVRRIFKPGEQIGYNCAIYNAQPDERRAAHFEVATVLYAEGREVYRSDPMQVDATDAASQRWLSLGGKLELGARTAAGEFVLQIVVTDKVKPRTASQWIDFTLR